MYSRTPRSWTASCLMLLSSPLVFAQLPSDTPSPEALARQWYNKLHEGRHHSMQSRQERALQYYQEGLELAQTDEQRVDTLLLMARAYEGWSSRTKAIETYKRILKAHVDTGHAPKILFRLGELHRSITLLPLGLPRKEQERIMKTEMTNQNAAPYFEQAVTSGPAFSAWVLASWGYLANIYQEEGSDERAWQILHRLATLNMEDVVNPTYRGPYLEMNAPELTLQERIDEARTLAAAVRQGAIRRLVAWSVVPGNLEQTLANLDSLAIRYPDTEIELLARKEQTRVIREEKDRLSEEAKRVLR